MEKVSFPDYDPDQHKHLKPWATTGKTPNRSRNIITSLHIEPEKMERINQRLQEKYRRIEAEEVRWESIGTEDADIILVAYGLTARIARRVMEMARDSGQRVGLLRPITLYPFPYKPLAQLAERAELILPLEMNAGQMVEDVRLAVEGRAAIEFYGRSGGVIPSPEEILVYLESLLTGISKTAGQKTSQMETAVP